MFLQYAYYPINFYFIIIIIIIIAFKRIGERIRFPVEAEIFPFTIVSRLTLGRAFHVREPGALCPGIILPRQETDYAQSGAEAKNAWSCTSSALYIICWYLIN
jgi:hypothetical protein